MGFSVSGATVILFLGMFISFGIVYTAANNGLEQVNDAYEDAADDELVAKNTAVDIASASVANEDGETYLTVEVTNEGTTDLSVGDTDLLVDGVYQRHADMKTVAVDGDSETDLWLPTETLRFNVSVSSSDPQVKVVTEPGVADAEVV